MRQLYYDVIPVSNVVDWSSVSVVLKCNYYGAVVNLCGVIIFGAVLDDVSR
jgi:hypothetical protein